MVAVANKLIRQTFKPEEQYGVLIFISKERPLLALTGAAQGKTQVCVFYGDNSG